MKMRPLNQAEYTMTIVKDLGMQTANHTPGAGKARYAMFECTECHTSFRARCGSTAAKKQTRCVTCTRNEAQTYKHPLYAIWNGIRQRCYNPKRKDYPHYGGSGVTMYPQWKDDFSSFFTWCIDNGWHKDIVIDKDIKCREQGISPSIYSPTTISFVTIQANSEEANGKPVMQFTKSGEFLAEYPSTAAAITALGRPYSARSSIANCARGVSKSSFGFTWKYKK